MNFQTWAREAANARLTDEQLAMIRKTATQIAEDDKHSPVATTLLKVLNHLNVVLADNAMVDVLALQERLDDRETRLKAMERAFFEKVVEVDRLKEKLESLEVRV